MDVVRISGFSNVPGGGLLCIESVRGAMPRGRGRTTQQGSYQCRGAGAAPHGRGRACPNHTAWANSGFFVPGLGEAGSTAWQHATWLDGPSLFVSFRIVLYRFVSIRIDSYRFVSIRIDPSCLISLSAGTSAFCVICDCLAFRIFSHRFVSIRIVSYRFVSFCDCLSICIDFVSICNDARVCLFI